MRFLVATALRKLLLVLVVVAIAVVTLAIVKPWKAPEASEQARLAERDSVWTSNPAAGFIESQYVTLADASWVPWAGRTTTVGRWYREAAGSLGLDRGAWTLAATTAGWTRSADLACPGQFRKRLGKWRAFLVVAPDATGQVLGVRIAFPPGPADATQSARRPDQPPPSRR